MTDIRTAMTVMNWNVAGAEPNVLELSRDAEESLTAYLYVWPNILVNIE